MLSYFKQLIFGVSSTKKRTAGGYDEPSEEETLSNQASLLDNPILLLYGDNSNRGVVVFALQDIPVNKPMVSEKGTQVVRSARDTVAVGGLTLTLTREALQEEDEIRRRQQQERDEQLRQQATLSNDAGSPSQPQTAQHKAERDVEAENRAKADEIRKADEDRPTKHKRRLSDDSVYVNQRKAHRLRHLTLTRPHVPVGRKLPTKPVSEFASLKPDFQGSRSFEEADLEDLRAEQAEETPSPKKFVPPRGAMALPMFDPSAVKSTLKRAAPKPPTEENEANEEAPRKPAPFGGKGFALPGLGDIGAVKLKKSAAAPKPAAQEEDKPAEQVDFRSMLKPAKK